MVDRQKFACRRCGACCRTKDGIVRVSDAEIARIAAFLGMSEADYVDKLDDIIIQLSSKGAPSKKDLDARAEFKALSSADYDAWLTQLASEPAVTGQKARAVAVLLLLIGALFLGEHVGWKQIAGVALCLAGIALVTSK